MSRVETYIPPFVYCPKCGSRIVVKPVSGEELEKIRREGYDEAKRGLCKCGVVLVICHLPMPQSPSYSIFFDIYRPTKEFLAMIEEMH